MVKQLCSLIEAFIPLPTPDTTSTTTTSAATPAHAVSSLTYDNNTIEQLYIFSIIWSIGGSLVETSRTIFAQFVQNLFISGSGTAAEPEISSVSATLPVPGNKGSYYDYYYDVSNSVWVAWSSIVPEYVEPAPFRFYEVMVPTQDSVLYRYNSSYTCISSYIS